MRSRHCSNRQANPVLSDVRGTATGGSFVDPRTFGLVKAAYGVGETLELLSIGRTSLYAAVKRGDIMPVKFGKEDFVLRQRSRHISDEAKGGYIKIGGRVIPSKKPM